MNKPTPFTKSWATDALALLAWAVVTLVVLMVGALVVKLGVEYLNWLTTWQFIR